MARWDILRGDRVRDAEVRPPREERQQESTGTSVSVGRGPTDAPSANTPERPEKPGQSGPARTAGRRTQHRDRGQPYALRSSEIAAMTDIGTFRTVDIRDLGRFAYGGNETRMNYDLESLRARGLVERKTLFRAHQEPRKVVALTETGASDSQESEWPSKGSGNLPRLCEDARNQPRRGPI